MGFFYESQQIKIELVPKPGFADTASKTTMDSAYASYKRSAGSSATSKSSSQASVFMDYQVKSSCFRHLLIVRELTEVIYLSTKLYASLWFGLGIHILSNFG